MGKIYRACVAEVCWPPFYTERETCRQRLTKDKHGCVHWNTCIVWRGQSVRYTVRRMCGSCQCWVIEGFNINSVRICNLTVFLVFRKQWPMKVDWFRWTLPEGHDVKNCMQPVKDRVIRVRFNADTVEHWQSDQSNIHSWILLIIMQCGELPSWGTPYYVWPWERMLVFRSIDLWD